MPKRETSTDATEAASHTSSVPSHATRRTKIDILRELLEQPSGAPLEALCAATGWQQHSVRAALSGLRKAGVSVERHKAEGPDRAIYRIVADARAMADISLDRNREPRDDTGQDSGAAQ